MKFSSKKMLAGILVGSMALSAVAMQQKGEENAYGSVTTVTAVGEMAENYSTNVSSPVSTGTVATSNEVAEVVLEVEETGTSLSDMSLFKSTDVYFQTLSSSAAYDQFYSQHGYDKVAHVFYNGEALPFSDAFPLIENGATFLPLAVFADAIGAETNYIAETHSVALNYQGDTITFDIGKAQFSVNGGASQELPYETFTANDRTMVPLRFITDAFDLSLYWNDGLKHVIAADLDSLTDGKSFTLMNNLFTFMNGGVTGQNAKINGSFDYVLTMDGKSMTMNSQVDAHANDDMSGVAYELDFAVDVTAFESEIRAMLNSMSPDPAANDEMVDVLLNSIATFDFNYMYDFENMVFYLQSDLIAESLPALSTSTNDLGINGDTWMKLELSDFMSTSEIASMQTMMNQMSGQGAVRTVEELVETMMEMTRYQDNYSVNSYGALKTILESANDTAFTAVEGGYKGSGSYTNGGQAVFFDLTLVTDEQDTVLGYTAVMNFQENSNDVVRMTMKQDSTNAAEIVVEAVYSGVSVSMKGAFDLEYTSEKASVRPSGSNIFDLSTYF